MAKFRKLSVVVEAEQFTDQTKNRVFNWITCNRYPYFIDGKPALKVQTPEGDVVATIGDWIIKDENGRFYVYKPDVFVKTYEQA